MANIRWIPTGYKVLWEAEMGNPRATLSDRDIRGYESECCLCLTLCVCKGLSLLQVGHQEEDNRKGLRRVFVKEAGLNCHGGRLCCPK